MKKITPRWYQTPLINGSYEHWRNGIQNVLVVAPTGAGKTIIKAMIAQEFARRKKYVMVMAHRDVLLSQISLSLAKLGVHHNLMCNNKAKTFITNLHVKELGTSYYDDNGRVCVASVKTLINRNTINWESLVGLWLMDEAHHVLRENTWGKATAKFNNAYGLGLTATPIRTDCKGLGRHADGVFDVMVQGPTLGDLIASGDLCRYRLVRTPLSHQIHKEMGSVRGSTEYNVAETKAVLSRNNITGDVVGTYKKFAMGLRGITFCRDIESSEQMAQAYRSAGVPAAALSSKDSDQVRWDAIDRYKKNELLQLVNCDLFGEGFDIPLCYAVSFASPTKSYGRYSQQFGRGTRNAPDKEFFWLFDHVDNVAEHLLPDNGLEWTLDAYEKRGKSSRVKSSRLTTCTNPDCMSDYELPASHCPWCGQQYEVAAKKPLKNVDGELVEMTHEELNQLQRQINKNNLTTEQYRKQVANYYNDPAVVGAMVKAHRNKNVYQSEVKNKIQQWCAQAYSMGLSENETRQQFLQMYGVDLFTAQTMNKQDSEKLMEKMQ